MSSEIGRTHVVDVEAGAAVPPEGHQLYARDTDKLYKSDGTTLTELASGGGAYSDEQAQDAIGAMVDSSLTYTDATPLLKVTAMTGDVTSTGANVTTIGNDKVTYAKMQNVSATDKLLGRDTAGAGDVEEISLAGGIEFTGSTSIKSSTRTLSRDSAGTTINNTVAETTVFSYSISGNTLGANDEIELNLISGFLNNTGVSRGYRTRVKLGGTTVIDVTTGATLLSSATRRMAKIAVWISAGGATNSQIVTMENTLASAGSLFGTVNTGVGMAYSTTTSWGMWNSGALSKDMTSSQTLEVTIELTTNSVNLEWKTYSGTLDLKRVT